MAEDTRRRREMAKSMILIVDDDREFTADLERELRARSYEVATATNRTQAEEMAKSTQPEMVVLGTMLPRGETFNLHKWLRGSTQFSETPIVVVDATPEKHLLKGWRKDEGMRIDADDYLMRPVAVAALAARMEKVMSRPMGQPVAKPLSKAAAKAAEKIRVLVADDHAVVRDGICAVLALQNDIQVIGEAVDGKDAVEKALELLPDIVLMDIVMPRMNGLEATKQICSEYDRAKVLILSQYDDQENMAAGKAAGAVGFIPKRVASSDLVAGIRSAWAGKTMVNPLAS
jgi:DNA-binding NarL/FixJ family response regulator